MAELKFDKDQDQRHPLFDPSSLYGQAHAGGQAEYRIRGYMHWLRARADRLRLPLRQSSAASESYRATLARRLASITPVLGDVKVLDAFSAETRILVTGAAQTHQQPSAERAELCLVREADGSHTLGVLLRLDSAQLFGAALTGTRFRCRVFLFEPEVIRRLEGLLCGRSYLDSLEPAVLENYPEVAGILAAVSELEGEWSAGQSEVRFARLSIPDSYDLFPPRAEPLQMVAILHPV
jgi:hypothetical protein